MHACIFTYIHTYIHTYIRIYIYICIHIHLYIHTHMLARRCVHLQIHPCVYARVSSPTCLAGCLLACLPACLSVCLSVCLCGCLPASVTQHSLFFSLRVYSRISICPSLRSLRISMCACNVSLSIIAVFTYPARICVLVWISLPGFRMISLYPVSSLADLSAKLVGTAPFSPASHFSLSLSPSLSLYHFRSVSASDLRSVSVSLLSVCFSFCIAVYICRVKF